MLVDVDSWPREHQACENLTQTIRTQLLEWENCESTSSNYKRLSSAIQMGLKQLSADIYQLKIKLDASKKQQNITLEEARSRQEQGDALQGQLNQMQQRFKDKSLRQSLFTAQPSGENRTPAVIDYTDINSLRQHQIDILERQNQGLEVLSETISRQRSLASQLGQEVDNQNGILSNLADTMDRVDSRINAETGNISEVDRKDSTGYYWLIIVLLFIAIIIVAVI